MMIPLFLPAAPQAQEWTPFIGFEPGEALQELGAPTEIFAHRGASAEEDNVVFFYPNRFYLFWFQNRVWQIRFDEKWEGELEGVTMGMPRSEVEALWGPSINEGDEHPTWILPDQGYPLRARLYFEDDRGLVDLYIYRSDW
ncbi:MAG: hypothetical protein MI717_11555 [Spirochaetales bacterium]|nr:hypothetical protein [Spirochaetales bacterium]